MSVSAYHLSPQEPPKWTLLIVVAKGLFGSNLFAFSSDTWNFEMSPQIWIYFVATIPLTIVTLGYWKYKTNQQRKKKKKEEAEESKRGMQSV
jgi:hypothetical protein